MLRYLMIFILLITLLSISLVGVAAQEDENPLPTNYTRFIRAVEDAIADDTLDDLWADIVASGQMPIIYDTRVIFMHEADAEYVGWVSGFGGLAPFGSSTFYIPLDGERLGDSNIWMAEALLPFDARFNYILLVDGEQIRVDPLAPNQQLEGAGYESTFWMPGYVYPETIIPRDDIEKGTFNEPVTVTSEFLERDVNVRVYLPVGYEDMSDDLPVMYVTDGNDYWHDEMGAMVTVLDNLYADGSLEPAIIAFIDARDVRTGTNLRGSELGANEDYARFLTEELIPYMDANYRTIADREARTAVGTSTGGVLMLYLGLNYTEFIGNLAIQSPFLLFSPLPAAYAALDEPLPLNIFMNQGTYDLTMPDTRLMRDYFADNGYPMLYMETNNMHGWSNWPATLDELLIYFYGVDGAESSIPPISNIEE